MYLQIWLTNWFRNGVEIGIDFLELFKWIKIRLEWDGIEIKIGIYNGFVHMYNIEHLRIVKHWW